MQVWPEGTDRIILDRVDSTMSEARNRAAGLNVPTWILALRQTAGTGRRGRAWATGAGDFSASLYYRPTDDPQAMALRSFVAALALHESLVMLTGREDLFKLKWPNDVLLRGGKLAGILLKSTSAPKGLIIGIGVNLKTLPDPETLEPQALTPKSLAQETGADISPEAFLAALAPAFERWESQMQTYGFAPIRNAWLARAANLGGEVSARVAGAVVSGTFTTVDDKGALVLQTPEGIRQISAGDVHFNERSFHAAGH